VEVIAAKRDKKELTPEAIEGFIRGFAQEKIPDYQMTAFLMATLFQGMTAKETLALTRSMINSGKTFSWEDCDFPTVDKHSTGGVGDKTSLILGPIVASYGVGVPMIAGRGLGHTGGTIDKLESIPGFQCEISEHAFRKNLKDIQLSIMAQTRDICPADKRIYGLRDVTATVESIPLICASIMSKKLAEGADALVLDVKFGSGAFMSTAADALNLAKKLKGIGVGFGRKVSAFVTNMDQPLGLLVGNSLEIEECLAILKNEDTKNLYQDTRELSLILSAEMLFLAGKAKNYKEGHKMAEKALQSGKAFEKFEALVVAQGGNLNELPQPRTHREIKASKNGYVKGFKTKEIGFASIEMGAGRLKTTDRINPVAGLIAHKKIGDRVQKGDVLFTLLSDSQKGFDEAQKRLESSVLLSPKKTKKIKLVHKKI
jgi:pyrimidine-nucleoside phosphorylase